MRISAGALGEVELVGQREGQELGRDGDLGEAAEHAERGDAVARRDSRALAARCARRRRPRCPGRTAASRLDLVLAARLQHLGERDAGGVRRRRPRRSPGVSGCAASRLRDVDELQGASGPVSSVICEGAHAARPLYRSLRSRYVRPRTRPLGDCSKVIALSAITVVLAERPARLLDVRPADRQASSFMRVACGDRKPAGMICVAAQVALGAGVAVGAR